MLILIISIYVLAGVCYWSVKTTKQLPAFIGWLLFVCFLPFVFFYSLAKTLPDFRKGGKYYGARWIVYVTAFFLVVLTAALITA